MSTNTAISGTSLINLDESIGRRAHQLMWDRKMTQTVLAARVGMDQSSVAKRLRGKLGWSATQVKTFADALETTVAYLYGETDNPTSPVGLGGIEPPAITVKGGQLAVVLPFVRKAA